MAERSGGAVAERKSAKNFFAQHTRPGHDNLLWRHDTWPSWDGSPMKTVNNDETKISCQLLLRQQ